MLGEHVERADARGRRVLRVHRNGVERGAAFQHLEAVGGDENALGRLIHAVIGAADTLHQSRRAFRRADIDDQIDIAPVDAEIERGGAHHRAQPALGHCGFDLAALRRVERAVVERDRQRLSSLMRQRSWKMTSAWLRVLTKTSVCGAP